jgi:hypothetical protein
MIEQNEKVVEEITTGSVEETAEDNTEKQIEEVVEKIDESKFDSAGNDEVAKVNLDTPPQPKEEENITKVNVDEKPTEEITNEEIPVIEEITVEDLKDKEVLEEKVEEAIEETITTGKPLPENIQKLVEFMDETGGDVNDYVRLNRDVSKMDDSDVLDEYYKNTKSHLTSEERSFLLEDNFGYDDNVEDEKTIRKKKIALKEQVAEARAYLDGQKSKYYEEIKAGSKLTDEQQKAINFFNEYNKESEKQKKLTEKSKRSFLNKTNSFFGQDFKGFEYNVGDKKYRFNVKDVDKVKTTQSDINNLVNKFVGEDQSTLEDAAGYHRSLFTAMNADAIAKHFYEQGKADAVKTQIAKDKNINLEPRKTHGEVNVDGVRVRALGESSSEMKNRSFKIRKRK